MLTKLITFGLLILAVWGFYFVLSGKNCWINRFRWQATWWMLEIDRRKYEANHPDDIDHAHWKGRVQYLEAKKVLEKYGVPRPRYFD